MIPCGEGNDEVPLFECDVISDERYGVGSGSGAVPSV
jgi:hypothetical protein